MLNRIVSISGGSGFIGSRIAKYLVAKGYNVNILTRNPDFPAKNNPSEGLSYVKFSNDTSLEDTVKIFDGNFSAINLAGASLSGKRWTDKYKRVIYDSRIKTTTKIAEAINNCTNPPKSFISSSATGYYGSDRGNEELTEGSNPGKDFLARLCCDWEKEALKSGSEKTRVVLIRTSVVLDKNEGALQKMMLPIKFFVGGWLGSGRQWFPWIHIDDLVKIYAEAVENESYSGAINAASPEPATNKEFSKLLAKVMHRPCLFSVPAFVLKIAVGELADSLLGSQKMIPEKLEHLGFEFQFQNLNDALHNILN